MYGDMLLYYYNTTMFVFIAAILDIKTAAIVGHICICFQINPSIAYRRLVFVDSVKYL